MSGDFWTVALVIAVLVVLGTAAVTIFLAVRLVRARKLLTEAGIPVHNKLAFWGAMAYVISPVDLMPDPILLDDIGVLLLALRSLHAAAEAAGITGRSGKKDQVSAPPWPSSERSEKSGVRKAAGRRP